MGGDAQGIKIRGVERIFHRGQSIAQPLDELNDDVGVRRILSQEFGSDRIIWRLLVIGHVLNPVDIGVVGPPGYEIF